MIVDDCTRLARQKEESLSNHGIEAIMCGDADVAFELAALHRPNVILVASTVMPAGSMALCRRLQADMGLRSLPLLVYARRYDPLEAALMLEAGAADYFGIGVTGRELAARVRRPLRIAAPSVRSPSVRLGEIVIDDGACEVTCRGHAVGVTATEFRILHGLTRSAGTVLSRKEIADLAGIEYLDADDRVIDTHIKNIRRKLGTEGLMLQTVRGFGYRMRVAG